MKLKDNLKIDKSILKLLINHFNYSIRDIKTYDELTNSEKSLVSRELFNILVESSK